MSTGLLDNNSNNNSNNNNNNNKNNIVVENGGKHPLGSKGLLYLPRKVGGRGRQSVENKYKLTKVKTAVNLCQNQDPTMKVVREFEERAVESGHHSLLKDAIKYAKELDLDLKLSELNPMCQTAYGKEASGKQIGVWAKRAQQQQFRQEITKDISQGKLLKIRWEDDQLSRSCFDWLKEWKTGPSNTIEAAEDLYQQLLPTKLYHHKKMGINTSPDVLCRMCRKCPSHLVRLQYFSTNKVPDETQLSLEDSVLQNASRSELGIQGTIMVLADPTKTNVRE